MESFSFTTTAKILQKGSTSLDFTQMFQDGELDPSDEILVSYDEDDDELTAVVVESNAQFGHVIEPVSMDTDPELVKEMSKLTHLEIYQ